MFNAIATTVGTAKPNAHGHDATSVEILLSTAKPI